MSQITHNLTCAKPLAWSPSYAANLPSIADEEDADEPPDLQALQSNGMFERKNVHRVYTNTSLLTKAIQGKVEASVEEHEISIPIIFTPSSTRRRSMASNFSLDSTAELTSDTGPTSRASTPSPPQPELGILHITDDHFAKLEATPRPIYRSAAPHPAPPADEPPKKRCISFACAVGPTAAEKVPARPTPMVKTTSADAPTRKTCIRFACPPRAASTQNTPRDQVLNSKPQRLSSATTLKNGPSDQPACAPQALSPAASPSRKASRAGPPPRPRYLRVTSTDLTGNASRFYGFASDEPREEDWIRDDKAATRSRITINDTLTKENTIRQLAKEAEEEEEAENAQDVDNDAEPDDADGDDDTEDVETIDDLEDNEDNDNGYATDSSGSEGYHSDEETGFADSDEDEDLEDQLVEDKSALHSQGGRLTTPDPSVAFRYGSIGNRSSDCSIAAGSYKTTLRVKPRRIRSRPTTPELPDSTDFVCGTLDEDRPLEEAYLSCLEARKRHKLLVIPQDIDPSFPASEPEDGNDDDNDVRAGNDVDEHDWMHGEMEDLHHEQDRSRRQKRDLHSPRRLRSPPPQHKLRGRSPRPTAGRTSPRRLRSPAPHLAAVGFDTNPSKSLPKPLGMFHQLRRRCHNKPAPGQDVHMRGAIDIVKGLEQKRSRRREKFLSKYCDRARKGQIPERNPLPGTGAEKMKEVGLLMAGKRDGRFVISV